MGARVRPDEFGFSLEVLGHGSLTVQHTSVFAALEIAGPAYLYSLRQALLSLQRQRRGASDERMEVNFSLVPINEFHPTDTCVGSPSLILEDGRLLVRVLGWPSIKPDPTKVRHLLAPFLARHRATCEDISVEREADPFDFHPNDDPFVEVLIDWPTKGRTVADAWKFGQEAHTLLAAGNGGEIKPSTALDILRAGHWELFRGQPESDWLEVKGEPYDHLAQHGQYELAKDVAAFANSPDGGIIVLGMTTQDQGDGETIAGYKEFPLRRVRRQAYRNYVAQRVYPRVSGFDVERIEGPEKGKGLAVLVVPAQPQHSHPFLVQGVLSQGKVLGAHVLLPVRREDDTAMMDAAALHARLRLGERAIAGE